MDARVKPGHDSVRVSASLSEMPGIKPGMTNENYSSGSVVKNSG
jgi:hypothetical protein